MSALEEQFALQLNSRGGLGLGRKWALGNEYVPRDKCLFCGTAFYAPPTQRARGGGKLCSTKCAGAYRTANRKPGYAYTCKRCGKTGMARKKQTYCSKECVLLARSPTERRCLNCKEAIKGAGLKYCSLKCRGAATCGQNNHGWKDKPMSQCVGCGKVYRARPGDRGLVCSMECWGKIKTKMFPGAPHPTGKGGKRDDLDGLYVRSRWEANWARYLNFLLKHGKILNWEYEPDTFEFHTIKKGTRFYTPDFKVFELNGKINYHEIKGYLDAAGQTKLTRMKRFYPNISLILIQKDEYRAVARKVAAMIPFWEVDAKKGRFG